MRLKEDIVSHCNAKTVYGIQGEEVKIISENGNVMIVENEMKKRFAVRIEKLTEEEIEPIIKDEEKIIIKPVQVAARRPKAKPAPLKQQSLFYE